MRKIPLLTIVIVHYNTWELLSSCLTSISSNTISEDIYQVIVVDNNSSISVASLLKKNFPHVICIENKENVGFSKANNQAIQGSKSEYILLLNPDTVLEADTLSEMLAYMQNHPQVGAATCQLILPNGTLDDACHRGYPTPWNSFCHFSGIGNIFPRSTIFNGYHLGYQDMDHVHDIDSACGAFLYISRKAGDEIGWLDETYFWYGEDIDFCFRLKKAGWKISYVPYVKAVHYKGVSSGIKKQSQHMTTADKETRIRSTHARFEVMRIFYRKHYLHLYPRWLTSFIFFSISLKEYITLFKQR